MNLIPSLIVAMACLAVTATAKNYDANYQNTDMGLLNFMSRSNHLIQRNPERSLECFAYYIPLINKIAEKYEADYKSCLANSVAGREGAEEATAGQRNDLATKADKSCASLSECVESKSVEGEYECYMNAGSENAKTMYEINVDASDGLADLVEQYRLIQNKENRCTNDTKREYEKESAEAYESLNNCILGISEVPTEGPPTDAPTEAPTNAPTEAPTDAPTEAPTDAPTEAPTDAPTDAPTEAPTEAPTDAPTEAHTDAPTEAPTEAPTDAPTEAPTDAPTEAPTDAPTDAPTEVPTEAPTDAPTNAPTDAPTDGPESAEDGYPEEDISVLRAVKNLKYRLQHRKRA